MKTGVRKYYPYCESIVKQAMQVLNNPPENREHLILEIDDLLARLAWESKVVINIVADLVGKEQARERALARVLYYIKVYDRLEPVGDGHDFFTWACD